MAKTNFSSSNKLLAEQTKATVAVTPDKLVNEIKDRAHAIYLQRGNATRSDLDDWLQAEKEIKAKYGIKA